MLCFLQPNISTNIINHTYAMVSLQRSISSNTYITYITQSVNVHSNLNVSITIYKNWFKFVLFVYNIYQLLLLLVLPARGVFSISLEDVNINRVKHLNILHRFFSLTKILEICYGVLLYHGCYLWRFGPVCSSPLRVVMQIQVSLMLIRTAFLIVSIRMPPITN